MDVFFAFAVLLLPSVQVITLLGTVASSDQFNRFSPGSASDNTVDPSVKGDPMTTLIGALNSARAFFILDYSQVPHTWSCQGSAVIPYPVVWAAPLYMIPTALVLLVGGWCLARSLRRAEISRDR